MNLKISQWSATKYDKQITKQVEQDHNAKNAGRFDKTLIADRTLKEIQKVASSARAFLYDNTLPWGDNGDRLLPATNYLEFVAKARAHKVEFEHAVKDFVLQYPDLKREARHRLNGMFRESDYPDLSSIGQKFDMAISFLPISDVDDFRLQVDQDEVDALKGQIENEINSRITQATKNIWTRINEAVKHMVDKLSVKDSVFRDSLVTNIRELVEVLPRLNFTQDDDINSVIESMKGLLVNPDELRKDTRLRNKKAKEAKAILAKISDFI